MLAKTRTSFLCALCAAPTAFCTLAKNDATEINSNSNTFNGVGETLANFSGKTLYVINSQIGISIKIQRPKNGFYMCTKCEKTEFLYSPILKALAM